MHECCFLQRLIRKRSRSEFVKGGYHLASTHVRVIQRSTAIGRYVAAEGVAFVRTKQLLWKKALPVPEYWLTHVYAKAEVDNVNSKRLNGVLGVEIIIYA